MATIPSISLIPSGVKAGKIYSVLPIDGSGDFTFDRGNGASTRINKQKLIESVSNDVPRLDYGSSDCPALLLEPSRTNLLPYSEEFTRSNWSKVNTTITPFYSISPDGSATASLLQRTSSSANYMSEAVPKSATATQVTGTWFVKKGDGDFFATRIQGAYPARVDLIYQHSTKSIFSVVANTFTTIDSAVEESANGFVKISLSVLTDSSSSMSFSCSPNSDASQIDGSGSSADSNVIIWGAQLEVGSYATSYIPTLTGSSQTRVADTANGAGNNQVINSIEGVLYVNLKTLSELGTFRTINLSQDLNNRIYILKRADNGKLEFRTENPSGQLNFSFVQDTTDASAKLAFMYGVNNFAVFINGINKNVSVTGNTFAANSLTDVDLTNSINQRFLGHIKELKVYKTALTDLELETLTSYTSFNAMALALNYTIQ